MIKKAGGSAPAFSVRTFVLAMKKSLYFFLLMAAPYFLPASANAQCSVCTRTTEQMGEKPAGKINTGILYLAATPLIIAGVVGYRWWKRNGD